MLRGFDEWAELILTRDGVQLFATPSINGMDKTRDQCGFTCLWRFVFYLNLQCFEIIVLLIIIIIIQVIKRFDGYQKEMVNLILFIFMIMQV